MGICALWIGVTSSQALAEAPATGTVSGTVTDETGHTVSGAQITIPDTGQEDVTGADGSYSISDIVAGAHTVEASLVGYEPVRAENVTVTPGHNATVDLKLSVRSVASTGVSSVRVPLRRRGIASHQSSSQTVLSAQGIEQTPTLTSLNNVIEAAVPGAVALPNGAVRIRGSDNQFSYYLDGAPMPANISASLSDQVNPKTIETMHVYTGGFPAAYGGQLAAVLDVTAKGGQAGRRESLVQQLVGGDATYETTAQCEGGSGPIAYFLSGFHGSTDFGLNPPSRESQHNSAWQNNGFAKFAYRSSASDVWTVHLGAQNASYEIPNPPDREALGQDDRQREDKGLVHLIWQRDAGPKMMRLALYSHEARVRFDPSPADLLPSQGTTSDPSSSDALNQTYQNQRAHYLGLRGDYAVPLPGRHRVQLGFDVNQVTGRQDFRVLFAPDSGLDPLTDNRRLSGGDAGIYVQDDWTTGRFDVNYGARYDIHTAETTTSQVSPRLNLSYHAGQRDTVHAFYNRLFMPVPVENVNFVTGTSTDSGDAVRVPIRPERQHYFEFGWEHRAGKTNVSADAYYRIARDIVDNEVLGNTQIEIPLNEAKGTVRGIEVSVDRTLSPTLALYASYAHSAGLAKGPVVGGLLGADDLPPGYFHDDHDVPNVATVELSYQRGRVSGMLEAHYASGLPYGELDDASGDPVKVNYLRLPSHFTMDGLLETRVGKSLKAALIVTNLFDKRYVITQDSPFRNEKWAQGRMVALRLTVSF
jgi:hypothetical protein